MSRTWVFQGNPERFDIDGYLRDNTGELLWRVATNSTEITPGDTVYLWRSGKDAGIVAESEVIERPRVQSDDPRAVGYWVEPQATLEDMRVRLRLRRVAQTRGVLKRKWLEKDPLLKELLIIRRPAGTNFGVDADHANRLAIFWANTGQDWTYAEVVAALWAYEQVWNQSISKTEGSVVDRVSRLIGRVIPGVYNKLMNLRSLDPRVEQKGLLGTGDMAERVWSEFFEPSSNTLRTQALNDTFHRLWPSAYGEISPETPEESAVRGAVDEEARRLEHHDLDELLATYNAQRRSPHPRRRTGTASMYERDPLVVAITKKRASYKCEVPGCAVPIFLTESGNRPYVETHHLTPLAEGGPDTIQNTACVCAIHHRELHVGKFRASLTGILRGLRLHG